MLCWSLCHVGFITGCGHGLHFSLGSLHITSFPLRFPGHFQFNPSKSSVFSNTFLLFKFWEVTKGNRNSLYCFGSFLSSLDQLEGKFIVPGTGLFKKYLLLVFHLLEEALSFHVTKPSLELHICTPSKLMCFLIAFPNILSVTSSSASNCSIFPISSFTAPVFSYPPSSSWSLFTFLASEITFCYTLTPQDLELGSTNKNMWHLCIWVASLSSIHLSAKLIISFYYSITVCI